MSLFTAYTHELGILRQHVLVVSVDLAAGKHGCVEDEVVLRKPCNCTTVSGWCQVCINGCNKDRVPVEA